ncbi:hypothetical protein Ccrd_025012 [Cynara cardunculus var. scolymus]|uniref:Tetratricopeptide-like helical n=1 Tax=Cynara cardunculus var. scolymus TaxID=59895 RepID=A0A124SAJ5_CYNCS|nr:hypothetical protein Ccrd_025012 [Cynara cardunculus var. scolymus]
MEIDIAEVGKLNCEREDGKTGGRKIRAVLQEGGVKGCHTLERDVNIAWKLHLENLEDNHILRRDLKYNRRSQSVQLRKLDHSVAQAMRVASSPQEWRERGKKLYSENNFVMATMCFERAGDRMWEKLAKALGLRTFAEQMRGMNFEAASSYLREPTTMFESIEKFEPAAS